MYSIEWQKLGLPHAPIPISLVERTRPDQIDIICAEISDPETDADLHDIRITKMIHGLCGTINRQSPCKVNEKYLKRHVRKLKADTITDNDGYPLYRHRSPDDNDRTIITKMKEKLLWSTTVKLFHIHHFFLKHSKAYCNVEYYDPVKSIKYICKYATKGSDMAIFGIQTSNINDEITRYQVGRYVNCNETLWRILSFPIHDSHPTVVHLGVHLENGQKVYFTASKAT
ncbi:hypothetical protein EVAR_10225_1 [Eumeta japonica]|uniref:Uncharacterized protein n=1 Tax=Eumeta variegata TaxID=151549 RepID=A0A4C1TEC0_EUMVA|nr:hypothetical protein EVAR_10225_1 [Eumeta japonica]